MDIFSEELEHYGISKLMKWYNFVASVMLLCDILPFVTRLSKGKSIDVTLLLDAIVLSSQTTAKPTEKPHPGPDNGDAILPGDDNTDGNYFKTTAQACMLIGVEVADNREADLFEEIRYSSFMMVIHGNNPANSYSKQK